MPSALTIQFDGDYVRRRQIKNIGWKDGTRPRNVLHLEKDDQIDIMGHPRFTVQHCGQTSVDEVVDTRLGQRVNKKFEQISFRHGENYRGLRF